MSNSKRSRRERRLGLESLETRQLLATMANFDHSPTHYIQSGPAKLQFRSFRAGGPTGTYMKLAEAGERGVSALSFDRTATGPRDAILAEFAFRVTSKTYYKPDAFDFALLSTARYGHLASRNGPDTGAGYADSLSIRFESSRHVDGMHDRYSDSFVQVIFNGQVVHDIDVNSVIDLAGHEWHRARIYVEPYKGEVTIELAPAGREPVKVMFWSRQHHHPPKLFDPVTKEVTEIPAPEDHHGTGEHFNIFAAGTRSCPMDVSLSPAGMKGSLSV